MYLALPAPQPTDGWAAMARLVLDSVSSAHTKRAYSKALQDFFGWYERSGQTGFRRSTVQAFRAWMAASTLAPATLNQRFVSDEQGIVRGQSGMHWPLPGAELVATKEQARPNLVDSR